MWDRSFPPPQSILRIRELRTRFGSTSGFPACAHVLFFGAVSVGSIPSQDSWWTIWCYHVLPCKLTWTCGVHILWLLLVSNMDVQNTWGNLRKWATSSGCSTSMLVYRRLYDTVIMKKQCWHWSRDIILAILIIYFDNIEIILWKKSCTTFKGLHLKPRAPNLILFVTTVINMELCEWRKSCTTCQHVIQNWTWGYRGASYALANVYG